MSLDDRVGPAVVAAIAYVDPGNFATNFAAGAEFDYLLAWVIVTANLTAMLIQSLSGKAGLATGRNLPGCPKTPPPSAADPFGCTVRPNDWAEVTTAGPPAPPMAPHPPLRDGT